MRDTIAFTTAEMHALHSISISGYTSRSRLDGGRGARFHPRQRFAYVELAPSRSAVDTFARGSASYSTPQRLLRGDAKYRAARASGRVDEGAIGAARPRSMELRFHCQRRGVATPKPESTRAHGNRAWPEYRREPSRRHELDGEGSPLHQKSPPPPARTPATQQVIATRRTAQSRSARRFVLRRGTHRRDGTRARGALSYLDEWGAVDSRCVVGHEDN